MRRHAWAAVAAGFGASAHAQTVTGNDLLAACKDTTLGPQIGFCAGYIIGQNEGFRAGVALPMMATGTAMTSADLNRTFTIISGICLPDEVEGGQLVDVTVRYLEAHPESRHEPARGLMFIALQDAFPCPTP